MLKTNDAAAPVSRDRSRPAAVTVWRSVAMWLAAITTAFLANTASAASGRSINVVLMVEGADVDSVRRELTDALPPRFSMQDPDTTKAALAKEGVMGSFADSLSNQRVRKQALAAVHKSLKQQGAPALIAIRTRRGRNNARETRVVLVMSEQVEPVVEEDITLGRNEKMTNKIGPLLAVPLEDIEAANEKAVAAAPKATTDKPSKRTREPAPEPLPAEPATDEPPPTAAPARVPASASAVSSANEAPAEDKATPKKKRDKVDFTNALIVIDVGLEAGARKMAYSDPLVGPLRSYLAPGVLGYGLAAQFYPGASTGMPFAKDIGVVFRYAGSLGFESQTKDGSQKATGSWSRSALGVRGRFLAGSKTTGPYIGVEGTYGTWAFVFEGDAPIVAEVPSVRYKYMRGAIDARFPFNAFSLTVGAGGMYVMSGGEFTDRFPNATIAGVDGTATAAYAFLPWLEARAEVNYTRIFSSAKSQRGDAFIAGGALDEYFIFHGGIAAVF
jgi:hypothetical protein